MTSFQEHFGLDKCLLMGHSMGGGICGLFASTFPERVHRLLMLDFIAFGSMPIKKHVRMMRKSVETHMKLNALIANTPADRVPAYSREDAVARAFLANQLLHGQDSISREAVETLMERGLKEVGDGKYTWTTDLRLRIPSPFNLLEEQVRASIREVREVGPWDSGPLGNEFSGWSD